MTSQPIGPLVQSFILEGLISIKGLRPTSVRSYRDALRLLLRFITADTGRRITKLTLADLSFERVLRFLQYLEVERANGVRTRNHRLAFLHTFFEYLGGRAPEMLAIAERVAAIPTKRVAPPETRFLERDEVGALFAGLPSRGLSALRDRALLLFLYNTGARVQEVADLQVADLDLRASRVRLHGKGDKWRTCPLWEETVRQLRRLVDQGAADRRDGPVFTSRSGRPLTRFGIYKIVRRHTDRLASCERSGIRRRISPHVFRHTTAVHLLEAGVEVNVIRGWLGHVSLDTTHRYAEINLRAKQQALEICQPPHEVSAALPRRPVWRDDDALLAWLESL